MAMFRLNIHFKAGLSVNYVAKYPNSYVDLLDVIAIADNSGTETCWKLFMRGGGEIEVSPHPDHRISFSSLKDKIDVAKIGR